MKQIKLTNYNFINNDKLFTKLSNIVLYIMVYLTATLYYSVMIIDRYSFLLLKSKIKSIPFVLGCCISDRFTYPNRNNLNTESKQSLDLNSLPDIFIRIALRRIFHFNQFKFFVNCKLTIIRCSHILRIKSVLLPNNV